jgi:hypothetical protein
MKNNIEELPIILNAKNISEIMGVSLKTAYELMNDKNFPLIRVGKIKRVEREKFFVWLGKQALEKR